MGHSTSRAWPRLREDLTLHAGPSDANGAPTWTIHDPARNQYIEIDWVAFEIISRLELGGVEAICLAISADTTLHVDVEAVEEALSFLDANELVQRHDAWGTQWLESRRTARQSTWHQALLHGYLFFRVPLLRPDAWLGKLLPRVDFFYRSFFLKLTALSLALGLWGIFRQWHTFEATLVDTVSFRGLATYGGALIVIKVLHELGHAFTAKRCGCRVPTMGVALLVMMPVAYTDVTESWKLDSHQKRLMIAGAGIATELIIGAWSLFAWSLLPDGSLRGTFFFLGTTSIVTTLVINASPFLRFDGYFLLCDILGMSNLHNRSFAYARWWLRERLFNLMDPRPELLSPYRQRFLIIFAFAAWLYRLVVFFGIALLVYHYFFKALGIILFGIEIWFFIARPIWGELVIWRQRWPDISPGLQQKPAFFVTLLILALLVVPFNVTVSTQGIFKPQKSFNVIAMRPVQVIALPPPIHSKIAKGEQLIALASFELEQKIKKSQIRIDTLTRQFGSAAFDASSLTQQPIIHDQLLSARDELNGLLAEKARLVPVAPFAGTIVDVDPDLFVGEWIPKNAPLVTLIDEGHWAVDCFVEEADLKRLGQGSWGLFIPEAPGIETMRLRIETIDFDATRVLSEPALGSNAAGGQILVRQQDKNLIPERAIYRVRLSVINNPGIRSTGYLRGRVVIFAWPKSILMGVIQGGIATLMREFGF